MKLTKPKQRINVKDVNDMFDNASDTMNGTRFRQLAEVTRGLQLPEEATAKARNSYYTARELFVKQCIALNYTDTEICRALKITGRILSQIKSKIFQAEVEALTKMSQLEHFVEYKLKQTEVVKELDTLIESYRSANNLQGLTAALKSKQDCLKEIKSAAQDVGLLDKKAEEIVFVNGQNTKEMSNDELVDGVTDGWNKIQRLLGQQPNTQLQPMVANTIGEANAKTNKLRFKVKNKIQPDGQ
jgi:hypothetical protein